MATTEERKIRIIADAQQAGATIKQMEMGVKALASQIRNLSPGTEEFAAKSKELTQVKNNLDTAKTAAYGVQKGFFDLNGTVGMLKTSLTGAFAVFAILDTVASFFSSSSQAAKEFEKSLSELSAITGAEGEDLQYFAEQAQKIGETSTFSASQVVEAYKLIGSAKPELLKNKEALASVTEQATILAEAAQMELPQAAQALTGALNAMNLPASEAGRVINVLAAGAKEGAAEIPDAAAALDKFGVAAASFNVTVEESTALIQTLAEKNIKGAEAGTALRNVLAKMATVKALPPEALDQLQKFGVDLEVVSDKSRPLEERLAELAKISGDATAITKVFGLENKIAGETLLQNVGKYSGLVKAVTGTSEAIRQAKINTENYDGAMKKLGSATESIRISVGTGLNKAFVVVVKGVTSLILGLKELPGWISENQTTFLALGAALVTFNASQIAATSATLYYTAVEKGRAIATRASTIASAALNAVMSANPIGLVIKAVSLLVVGFMALYNNSQTVRAGISGLFEVAKEVFKVISESISQFVGGFRKALDGDIVGGLKDMGQAIVKANPIGLALTEGKRLGEAFNRGYQDKINEENGAKKKPGSPPVDGSAPAADGSQGGNTQESYATEGDNLTDKEIKAKEKAAAKKEKEEEKHQQRMQKLREDYEAKAAQAASDLESLKAAISEKGNSDKLGKLIAAHSRQLAEIEKNRQEVKKNTALSEEERLALLAQYEEAEKLLKQKFAEDKAAIEAEQAEKDKEKKQAELEAKLEEEAAKQEEELLKIEQQFETAVNAEQAKADAIYEIQKAAAERELALLEESGTASAAAIQKAKNKILAIETEHNKQKVENAQKTEKLKRDIAMASLDIAKNILSLGVELLGEDEKARKKHAKAIKAFSIAAILVSLGEEIASIWADAARYGPVAGPIIGGLRTGISTARAYMGIRKVQAQEFAQGGMTAMKNRVINMVNVGGVWQAAKDVGTFAAGGQVKSTSLGVIGEKGAEWVAPNWMLRSPRYANLIGYLEAARVNRRFESGGTTAATALPSPPLPGSDAAMQEKMLQEMMAINTRLAQYQAEIMAWQRELQVVNNLTETDKGLALLHKIENDSRIS